MGYRVGIINKHGELEPSETAESVLITVFRRKWDKLQVAYQKNPEIKKYVLPYFRELVDRGIDVTVCGHNVALLKLMQNERNVEFEAVRFTAGSGACRGYCGLKLKPNYPYFEMKSVRPAICDVDIMNAIGSDFGPGMNMDAIGELTGSEFFPNPEDLIFDDNFELPEMHELNNS